MRPIDIAPADLETVRCILREHAPELEVRAFGSRVSFTARETSDLDLALLTEEPLSIARMTNLKATFTKSYLPFRVDIVDWASASESFQKVIEREHVVLVEKQGTTDSDQVVTVYGILSADRQKNSLTDLCHHENGIQTGPFGSQLHQRDYVPVGTPIITVEHLGENRITHINLPRVSDNDKERLSKYTLRKGDIVFSRVGSVDRRALVREAEEGWLFSGRCLRVRPDPNKVDPKFLSYFFGWRPFQEHIRSIAVGATMPSLNTQLLSDVFIHYPSLSTQRAIANILGTLDDKIELNHRMNKTLEEMAQALFKSWFIDFAPVRSKMEGSDTGLPQHFADLFPDRLVDSEIGEIPDGWDVGCLADIASSPRRSFDPADICGGTPYIGLRHMPRHSIALIEWERSEKVTSNKSAFKQGEFLFGKLRPYFHKVGLAPVSGICSTDIVVISPNSITWSAFVLATISSIDFIAYTNQTSTGTKMPRTSWKTMNRYALCLPPEPVVQLLQNVTEPMLYRIVTNIHHNRNLAALRDILLPKLVSGMLRVEDAAKIVATI